MSEKQCRNEKVQNGNDSFLVDKQFWNSSEGRIIRSIVLDHISEKQKIAADCKLLDQSFNEGYEGLLNRGFIEVKKDGKILVKRQLYCQCISYFLEQQKVLVNWAQEWRNQRRIDPLSRSNASHFYLAGKSLHDFYDILIQQAKHSILVVNPPLSRSHISDSLLEMTAKGVSVCVLTYRIESEQFKDELVTKGIRVCEDVSIHAKLAVVDDRIAVVSSMNFQTDDPEEMWDAGIVTLDKDTVSAISRSIIKKHNDIFIASKMT